MKVCIFDGCEKPQLVKGYCDGHRSQIRRGQELQPLKVVNRDPICVFIGCDKEHCANGYCEAHNKQLQRGQNLRPLWENKDKVCEFDGCDKKHSARGYCKGHYSQLMKGQEVKSFIIRATGGHLNPAGYNVIGKNGDHVLEHRWIMEQHLGRKLLPYEKVHHLNGVRNDNRLENLELWSVSQPSGQRVVDKIKWAKEILALYGEEESLWVVQEQDPAHVGT